MALTPELVKNENKLLMEQIEHYKTKAQMKPQINVPMEGAHRMRGASPRMPTTPRSPQNNTAQSFYPNQNVGLRFEDSLSHRTKHRRPCRETTSSRTAASTC